MKWNNNAHTASSVVGYSTPQRKKKEGEEEKRKIIISITSSQIFFFPFLFLPFVCPSSLLYSVYFHLFISLLSLSLCVLCFFLCVCLFFSLFCSRVLTSIRFNTLLSIVFLYFFPPSLTPFSPSSSSTIVWLFHSLIAPYNLEESRCEQEKKWLKISILFQEMKESIRLIAIYFYSRVIRKISTNIHTVKTLK